VEKFASCLEFHCTTENKKKQVLITGLQKAKYEMLPSQANLQKS